MLNNDFLVDNLPQCPNCLSRDLSSYEVIEEVMHGNDANLIKLSVSIPAFNCKCCGMDFTDERAEDIRHEAICRHLNVMPPREVRAARGNFSQQEFADLTRLGRASIARWETGTLIQNASNDSYLYLMSFADNVERLRERVNLPNSSVVTNFGRFRKITPAQQDQLRAESEVFDLFI